MRFLLSLCFVLIMGATSAQSLKTEIDQVYNFKPSKLSKAEQQAKFPAMDKLFDQIKNDTAKYLPQLRIELIATGHNSYFYYDGCALLLTLSPKLPDEMLIARTLVRADIEDLSPESYTRMLNKLANDGVNTTAAAMKILDDDKFSFFIHLHSFTFDQSYSLSYALLPQKDLNYVDALVGIFKKSSPTAQRSIIMTLWFAYSCKGDALIKAASEDTSLKKEVRSFAKEAMDHSPMGKAESDYVKTLDQAALSKLRSDALMRYSDEAAGELDLTTKVLRRDTPCRQ